MVRLSCFAETLQVACASRFCQGISFARKWVCMLQEIDMMKYVSRDPNITQFFGAAIEGDNMLLIFEYMEVSQKASRRHFPLLLLCILLVGQPCCVFVLMPKRTTPPDMQFCLGEDSPAPADHWLWWLHPRLGMLAHSRLWPSPLQLANQRAAL